MEPREFFEGLARGVDPAKTAGMSNSYVFEIDGAGTWTVAVADGAVTSRGRHRRRLHDPRLRGELRGDLAGEQNPTAAYMSGKLKIKGDMGAAMKLQKLF